MFNVDFVLRDEMWSGSFFLCSPLLKKKKKKKKEHKHNDVVSVSNFASRSICPLQFDAASIKTEHHSLHREKRVVYGTLQNHHLVTLRVEQMHSKHCFIFKRSRGYTSKERERNRARERVWLCFPCAVSIFAMGHLFPRTLFGYMSRAQTC